MCITLPSAAYGAGYRYWSYWQLDGDDWSYATTGPASHRPDDGDVDGWRFTASSEADAAGPRSTPSFDRVCAGTRIKDGYKRVALVLDYGTGKDAPPGEPVPKSRPVTSCVVAAEDATSLEVLNRETRTRSASNGLLCSINGFPSHGCAESATKTATPKAASSPSGTGDTGGDGGSSTAVALLVGLAIGGGLIAAMTARRRREHR